jgi:hypothetical protein
VLDVIGVSPASEQIQTRRRLQRAEGIIPPLVCKFERLRGQTDVLVKLLRDAALET